MTDRQTDGQTDIPPLAISAVCIARYANALVKTMVICSTRLGEVVCIRLPADVKIDDRVTLKCWAYVDARSELSRVVVTRPTTISGTYAGT